MQHINIAPQDFCYWLQGFAELSADPPTAEQWQSIKEHLALVFKKVTPPHPETRRQQCCRASLIRFASETTAPGQTNHHLAIHRLFADMTKAQTISDALDAYNAWRRGADTEQPDPVALGKLIDDAAKRLRELEQMVLDGAEVEGISFSPQGGNKFLALCRDGFKKCGIAMERIEPDGRVTRAWVGTHGMVLWPRTECEAGIERAKIADLEREVTHWKANHANEVKRARILKERTDMPMERVAAYDQWQHDLASLFKLSGEVRRLRALRFPTELRKMWSGTEVQEWLNQNLAA